MDHASACFEMELLVKCENLFFNLDGRRNSVTSEKFIAKIDSGEGSPKPNDVFSERFYYMDAQNYCVHLYLFKLRMLIEFHWRFKWQCFHNSWRKEKPGFDLWKKNIKGKQRWWIDDSFTLLFETTGAIRKEEKITQVHVASKIFECWEIHIYSIPRFSNPCFIC